VVDAIKYDGSCFQFGMSVVRSGQRQQFVFGGKRCCRPICNGKVQQVLCVRDGTRDDNNTVRLSHVADMSVEVQLGSFTH